MIYKQDNNEVAPNICDKYWRLLIQSVNMLVKITNSYLSCSKQCLALTDKLFSDKKCYISLKSHDTGALGSIDFKRLKKTLPKIKTLAHIMELILHF